MNSSISDALLSNVNVDAFLQPKVSTLIQLDVYIVFLPYSHLDNFIVHEGSPLERKQWFIWGCVLPRPLV